MVHDEGGPTSSQVLDELPYGVWVARAPTGEVLYTNRAFRVIMGMEAVEGAPIQAAPAVYGIHDRQGRLCPVERLPFSRALQSGAPVVVDDLVIHRGNGSRVWVRAWANPVRDANGAITHVAIAFIDITTEVLAESKRAAAERQLAVAIHHAPVLLFTIDQRGVLTASEGAILDRIGRERTLVGQSMLEVFKDHPTVPGSIRRALAGETVTYSVDVVGLTIDIWLGPVRDAEGNPAGAIGVGTDVTERRRLQARVAHDDRVRAMGTLAASVAHEINNPLTYVIGSVKAAVQRAQALGGEDARQLVELLGPALAGTERMQQVTRDLSTFARPDQQRLAAVDPCAVVRSALNLVRKEIEARARLVELLEDCPPVLANQTQLTQVLVNLLINAWQALPEPDPGRHVIGVRTSSSAGQACVEVWDSGPGVPAARRDEIFEPFVSSKAVGHGTGLGLFVCRNIVTGLGGHITVQDGPAGGALFRVLLPPAPADAVRSPGAPVAAGASVAGRSVLIIDDDERVGNVLAALLRAAGCAVQSVQDARAGLDLLLGDTRFDVAYCDLMMTGTSGVEVFEELRRRAPERLDRVVFMTGGAFTARSRDFVERHRDRCVEKPFDVVADLRRRVG